MIHKGIQLAGSVFLALGVLVSMTSWLAAAEGANVCDTPGISYPTIQEAIYDPECAVIRIGAGTFLENLLIARSLSLVGEGAELTIIDGQERESVIRIVPQAAAMHQPAPDVTISGVTLVNGVAGRGGGVYVENSTVVISATHMHGNRAEGTIPNSRGGALFAGTGSDVLIVDSELSGNSSGRGTVMLTDGRLRVERCLISDNSGGGIATEQTESGQAREVDVRDSLISGNTGVLGAAIFNSRSTMTITGSTLSQNQSSSTSGGGAIYNSSGRLALIGSEVLTNTELTGDGGGIYNYVDGHILISDSIVAGNDAGYNNAGGALANVHATGIVEIVDSIFRNNTAADDGGAIANNGTLTVTDTLLVGNMTTDCGGGGAIFGRDLGTIALERVTLRQNAASQTNCTGSRGGAILMDGGSLQVQASSFSGNWAQSGGAIASDGYTVMVIGDSTFNENEATSTGGGLSLSGGGTLTMTNSTLSGNVASSGGALLSDYWQIELINTTIAGNRITVPGLGRASLRIPSTNGVGQVRLRNTIVANTEGGLDCDARYPETLVTLGGNLDSDNTCQLNPVQDKPGVDPWLWPLDDYGGLTATHLPRYGSPVIDAGLNWGCPATDQRGVLRPLDGDSDGLVICDTGAVEYVLPLATNLLYLPVLEK